MSTAAPEAYPSFRPLARLVLQSALPRPQKVVLQALLAYARPDLTVYHAQEQLAWECDYTRPIIKAALAALKAQAILRILQRPHQHYSTEYAIDLSRLPSRASYGAHTVAGNVSIEDGLTMPVQEVNNLPAEDERSVFQPVIGLPAGEPGGQSVSPSGQLVDPQVVQVVQEKVFFLSDESTSPRPSTSRGYRSPSVPRPQPAPRRPPETPAPETLPLTEALRRWAADTVPGLPLDHERDKFLCYARARGLTNVDWSEALKFWWLEAHARAVRRGALQLPAVPRPALAQEPPPLYDAELHAQMQADIARLCGPMGPSVPRTNDNRELHRRHSSLSLAAEGIALEHDPAYLVQMRARKAVLQTQAALLQAQAAQTGPEDRLHQCGLKTTVSDRCKSSHIDTSTIVPLRLRHAFG